jgi:ribosomal protein L29
MRKSITYALAAAVVLLIGGSTALYMRYRSTTARLADSQASEQSMQDRYARTISAIAEIQDSLNAISFGENGVQVVSKELQQEQHLTGPQSRDVLDRIADLRNSILRSKARILQLESSLHKSGVKVSGLEKLVAQLKRTVEDREQSIAQLSTQVDSLQTQVTGLATQVQEGQDTLQVKNARIEEDRHALATVYYIMGSKQELTRSGVVMAKGGLLGVGKTLLPTGTMNESQFTPLDTDQETVIQTMAPKAKLLSAQPPGSYEWRLVDGHMELHILDPLRFRQIKELVILTT